MDVNSKVVHMFVLNSAKQVRERIREIRFADGYGNAA